MNLPQYLSVGQPSQVAQQSISPSHPVGVSPLNAQTISAVAIIFAVAALLQALANLVKVCKS